MADSASKHTSTPILSQVVKLWPPYDPAKQPGHEQQPGVALEDATTDSDSLASPAMSAEAAAQRGDGHDGDAPPQATHHDISHVYGEVVVDSFCTFLQSNQWLGSADAPRTFVDLGSGAGACIAAAVASARFEHCIGVELEEDWFQCSSERFAALQEALSMPAAADDGCGADGWTRCTLQLAGSTLSECTVALKQSSMFDADWVAMACPDKAPAVVFCNATALNIPQMQRLAQACEKLPAGSIVLTTTAALPSRLFDSAKLAERLPMSWGSTSTVHVAVRKKLGKWAARMLPRY